MTENELLLAMSELLDQKLKSELQPVKDDIHGIKAELQPMKDDICNIKSELQPMKDDIRNIKLHLENVTDKNIQLLAENYVPAAKRFEKAAELIESMKADIDVLKMVVKDHSIKLQQLA